jgi:transcription antitermination factor NusG
MTAIIRENRIETGEGNPAWYAVCVRSRCEGLVSESLRTKGYDQFLPTYPCFRRWSDRKKEIEQPLFPNYLFCRFDVNRRLPILQSSHVISIAGAGKTSIAVSDQEIDAIRAIVRSGLPAEPWPHLIAGSKIYIERGPLAGLEGIALKVEKSYRLIVTVPLLQRAVMVEIDRAWARPIPEKAFIAGNPARTQVSPSENRLGVRAGAS